MMAIDDLLDRGRDARRRRDEAASELAAVLQALEGLAGGDMLDATQKRELSRPRDPRGGSSPAGAPAREPGARAGGARRRRPARSRAGRNGAGPGVRAGP